MRQECQTGYFFNRELSPKILFYHVDYIIIVLGSRLIFMEVWSGIKMKKIMFILLIMILAVLSCGKTENHMDAENKMNKKYSDFWIYFKSVEEKAENISKLSPQEQKELLDGLKEKLMQIDRNLDVELSGQKKELFITSGGIKNSFTSVKKLAESAPKDLGWKVTAFKQRKELPFTLAFDNSYFLNSGDILFKITEDGEYLDIVIFFDGQEELQKDQRSQVIFEFLDGILGEYDTETYIGTIDTDSGPDSTFVNAEKLREAVDDFKKKTAKIK